MTHREIDIARRALLRHALNGACGLALASLVPWHTSEAWEEEEQLSWANEAERIIATIQHPKRTSNVTIDVTRSSPGAEDGLRVIQSAIHAVALKGGGKVVVSPGEWHVRGPLRLLSHVELHLSKGARIVFGGAPSEYLPPVFTRWEGTEALSVSAFIYAHGASDIAITGKGTICGDGASARSRGFSIQALDQEKLRAMGEDGTPLAERVFGEGHVLPPSLLQCVDCQRVLVEGVRVEDYPFWGIHMVYSEDITIRDVSISSVLANNDGIDIDSSKRVTIERCTFFNGDDCIAIKSGRDRDGRSVGKPSEDIVIHNCYMRWGKAAGVAIGSEMSGGVRNVYILSCRMDLVSLGLNIKSNLDRGGFVEHIRMGRVSIGTCTDSVVHLTTMYHSYRGGSHIPRFRDIAIDKVWCQRAEEGLSLQADPEGPIKEFVARTVTVDSVHTPLVKTNVDSLVLENVVMNGERLVA